MVAKYINPEPLQKGDAIGILSPSSPIIPGAIDAGILYLENKGFKVKLSKHINDAERFLAGKDEDRAKDLMDFFKDPEVKAIIATRGGQGSQRLLPLLDYDVINAYPKIVVGFSDTTALQLGLLKMTGLISYTGFTLTVEPNSLLDQTLSSCLRGESYKLVEGIPVYPGIVEGPLVGGNLTLITTLMGTPYQPDFKGSILFFEEVDVEPYNIDRMLSQLDLAGVFDQVVGVIIGQFENCIHKEVNKGDGTIKDVINEWSKRIKLPCIKDFPYGHGAKKCVLPIGKRVSLDVNRRTTSILPQ